MHPDTLAYNDALTPADKAICDLLAAEIDRALADAENELSYNSDLEILELLKKL